MADDKTTKMPEQPVTDTGPGKETPPEPEKTPTPPEAEKKTEQQAKSPQVSVYDFAEIMKGKKAEERAAASGGEKPAPAKTEKPEKQPEAPKKSEGKQEKPKEPEQPKRRGRPPKEDKDKTAAPKPKAPAQKKQQTAPKEKPEKKAAPTVQAAPAPKEPEGPKEAPRRGEEQIVYIKLNELHAFKNHPFEVRDDEEMRAMVSSVKDKGVTQPAIVRPREDGGYEIVSGQDICFAPDGDYAAAVERISGRAAVPGDFVDTAGRVLGTHRGVIHYTVGQRRGLGISAPERLYVCGVSAEDNTVTLGGKKALLRAWIEAGTFHWISGTAQERPFSCGVKLSGFGQAGHLPVSSQYLSGQEVNFSQNGRLLDTLCQRGGRRGPGGSRGLALCAADRCAGGYGLLF